MHSVFLVKKRMRELPKKAGHASTESSGCYFFSLVAAGAFSCISIRQEYPATNPPSVPARRNTNSRRSPWSVLINGSCASLPCSCAYFSTTDSSTPGHFSLPKAAREKNTDNRIQTKTIFSKYLLFGFDFSDF